MTIDDAITQAQALVTLLQGLKSGAGTTPAPAPAPTPTPVPPPPPATRYPVAKVDIHDALYLYKMTSPYRSALRMVPGSHQLFFDVLTDRNGKTYWQLLNADGSETSASMALKLSVNQWINGALASNEYPTFDVNAYAGPLKAIYPALVAEKLKS